jgi:hypothetical protein
VFELETEPLRTPGFASLIERVTAWAADPSADRIRDAFRVLEAAAREPGHGAIVDGWEPGLDWLRGSGPDRSTRRSAPEYSHQA